MNGTRAGDVYDCVQQLPSDLLSEPLAALCKVVAGLESRAPTNEHTPEAARGEVAWREMVWRQAFSAALAIERPSIDECDDMDDADDQGEAFHSIAGRAKFAGLIADAALAEWRKRWQK